MLVTSEKELDSALGEIGTLQGKLAAINYRVNAVIEQAKRIYQDEATILVDGMLLVSIPDRIKALEAAIREFAESRRSLLLAGLKTKSRKFTHGTIGWAEKRKSIKELPESEEVREGLLKRLITAVINCLKRVGLLDGLKAKAAAVYNVELKLNKSAVLDLVEKQQITPDQLKALGLCVAGGQDELWIKPAEVQVMPHAGPTS